MMNYKRSNNRLEIQLSGAFNLSLVREIKTLINDKTELYIDMKHVPFVNSEAIIFLHNRIKNQKKVRLKNPPKILFQALHILGLHKVWDLKTIIER